MQDTMLVLNYITGKKEEIIGRNQIIKRVKGNLSHLNNSKELKKRNLEIGDLHSIYYGLDEILEYGQARVFDYPRIEWFINEGFNVSLDKDGCTATVCL